MERKPPNERFAWLQNALGRKISDTLAAHLLQAWLLGAQKPMLCDFLDAVGIKRDDDGTVENLPGFAAEGEAAEGGRSTASRNIRRKRSRFICTLSTTWTAK